MNRKSNQFFIITLFLAIVTCSSVANADRDKGNSWKHSNKYEEHGKDKHKKNKQHRLKEKDDDHHNSLTISFGDHNKVIISEYLAREYAPNCPPGLAKKHNGCLPPGIAKKRYVIGKPFHGQWHPVPHDLLSMLDPAPIGYQYVKVDKDVLLISEASKKVIDAVTLLSAVGK